MKAQHQRERAQYVADDKESAKRDAEEAEFNRNAAEVVADFNELGAAKTRFEARMAEKQAELDELNETEEPDQQKVFLLEDYIYIYQEQIAIVEGQIENARADFEQISQEKELREELKKQQAAQKAKQNEYNDLKGTLDENKVLLDEAKW